MHACDERTGLTTIAISWNQIEASHFATMITVFLYLEHVGEDVGADVGELVGAEVGVHAPSVVHIPAAYVSEAPTQEFAPVQVPAAATKVDVVSLQEPTPVQEPAAMDPWASTHASCLLQEPAAMAAIAPLQAFSPRQESAPTRELKP